MPRAHREIGDASGGEPSIRAVRDGASVVTPSRALADPSTSTWIAVLLLALLSLATTALGVGLALRLRENAKAITTGIGFSAGLMVLISVADLMPPAIAASGLGTALGAAALGALLIASLNLLLPHTHFSPEPGILVTPALRSAYLVVFGLILHDFPEGFAMAHAYVESPALGVRVALAIALHNLPEEFAMAAPVAALAPGRFLFAAAALSALAEPAGAILGLIAVSLDPSMNASFLAFAAGAMLFIALHELPIVARAHDGPGGFLLGGALSILVHGLLARWAAL